MRTTGVMYNAHTYTKAINARKKMVNNIIYGFLGIYVQTAISNAKNITKNTVNGLSKNAIDVIPRA